MPSRPRLRRLAATVLLVWLFALASGIVNACVVSGELRHGGRFVPEAVATVHAHHDGMAMDEAAPQAGHQHPGGQGKPPCERLCDTPAAARSADNELTSALAGFWLAPAPLPALSLPPIPMATHGLPQARAPWRPAVPLPIAFQRLTL